ncbi:hypothetical protein AMURIS_02235 [Acetatifactor muris]|jgi:membrane protein implicated in regulation of membrane protease activity|uniref:NfeD-like C-terminal domain-containing protein n=1 Tax=Acetatifactor muris TaxID=879566 RepID=A0A2K4ZGD1_9FIRM|nr:NfeD family protein [Acetatifactor muris]SOY29514.1 hypothetical protein AMURIS_02235 [Acetatifactor muris]
MEEMLIFWLVLLILCIGIEVLTMGLTTIWFAGGALVAIFASLLYAPIFVQIILFFLVSVSLLFFTRPIAVRYFNRDRVKTNVESMVGRQAIVTEEIDNLQAVGQVTVNGQEWSARSADDKVRIPTGSVVTVAAISGVKLIVRIQEQFGTQERAEETAESAQREMEQVASGAEGVRQAEANTAGSADELSPEPGTAEDEN